MGYPEGDGLAACVDGVGVVGVDGDALDLAGAGFATVGLGPGLAVVLAAEDAVATGGGVDAIGRAGLNGDLVDVPLLDLVGSDGPVGACVVNRYYTFSGGNVEDGAHEYVLSQELFALVCCEACCERR
jgi:hypothetical protein